MAVALALTATLALAGCGGGGDAQSTATSAKSKDSSARPHPPLTKPGPLPNQGTTAIAPGVPTVKGGDNSIQAYGTEADSTERLRVASLAKSYLEAQATGRWSEACGDLRASVRQKFEALAASPSFAGKGCGAVMAAILGKRSPAQLREAADIQVLSLRVQGARAFVIYRDGTGKPFALSLVNEGGQWKLNALAGVGLVL